MADETGNLAAADAGVSMILPPPGRAHSCMTDNFPENVHAIGTLATCSGCGSWYRLIAHHPGPAQRVWKRVCWSDFRSRRRIAEATSAIPLGDQGGRT